MSPREDADPVRVELIPAPRPPVDPHGPTGSVQEADLVLPANRRPEIWRSDYLERLAAAYWRYPRRISLRLLRIVDVPGGHAIALLWRRIVLMRFRRPQYLTGPGFGQVSWPIERGLLVLRPGRGQLRLSVRRLEPAPETRVRVRSEVEGYFPSLRGSGRLAKLGAPLYAATQLRVHIALTNGFLRSLARLDLPPARSSAIEE